MMGLESPDAPAILITWEKLKMLNKLIAIAIAATLIIQPVAAVEQSKPANMQTCNADLVVGIAIVGVGLVLLIEKLRSYTHSLKQQIEIDELKAKAKHCK